MVESALAPDRRLHKTKPRLFCPRLALLSLSAPVSCLPVVCMFFWVCFFVCFVPCLSVSAPRRRGPVSRARFALSWEKKKKKKRGWLQNDNGVARGGELDPNSPRRKKPWRPLPCQAAHKGAARRRGFFYGLVKRPERDERGASSSPNFCRLEASGGVGASPRSLPAALLERAFCVIGSQCVLSENTLCPNNRSRSLSGCLSLSLSVKSARDIQSWKKASKQKKPGIPRQRGKFWPRGGFVINPPRLLFPPRGVCVCVCALLVVVAVAIVCRHRPLPLPSSAVCLPSSCLRKCCLVGCSGGVVD